VGETQQKMREKGSELATARRVGETQQKSRERE
jgi:hypothetical protein